ncbi:MAG TPA: alkaline phosphatase family protein [Vicinamibacteria bacterium]|nr:alkaline phosphatase family protein [Vicinamibacteria bacterium]
MARTLYPGGVGVAQSGELHILDTTDPVAPREVLDPPTRFNYPPRDLAAGLDGNGTRTVVIAASPRTYFQNNGEIVVYTELVSTPANLFVYDVTTDQPQWVGAASLTSNILDGYPNRAVLRGSSVYVATARKGIQVVDLAGTRAGFPDAGFGPANPDSAQGSAMVPINQSLFNSGINQGAVVTIPLDPDPSKNATLNLNDLKVGDFVVNGQSQPLVFATGNMAEIALVVASPTSAQVLLKQQLQNVQGSLTWGTAIALGHFADKDVALVGGYGTVAGSGSTAVLAVVDISNPTVPVVLSILKLTGLSSVGDVLVKDNTVLVSGGVSAGLAVLLDLTQPGSPEFVGTLSGVASRLALTDKNILFSADRTFLAGAATPLSGVRTAALATTAVIYQITPSGLVRNQGILVTEKDVKINFGVVPSSYKIGTAQVEIYRNGALIQTLAATTSGSKGTATWPAGAVVDPKAVYTARAVIEPQTDKVLQSAFKTIPLVRIVFVDKRGEEAFAPLTSNPRPVVTLDPVAASDVTLIGDGTQAQVRVSGQVTDVLADIVDSHAADITQVFVGDQTYPVTPVPEPASVTRPFAFRATFQTTVTVGISDGSNTVSVEAENTIGNRGYGSFTINAQQSGPLPATAPTGSAYDTKFLDPFTLVASAMTTTVPNSLVLYHGATSPTGSETPLVETGVGTLTFTGVTPDLGTTSLSLQAPVSGDTSARRVVPVVLSSLGLSIVKQSYEFLETAPGSGLFRNPALRLPSNDTMEVLLAGPLDPSVIDTIRVNVRSALDQDAVTLTETAPASQTFTGSTPVPGLGTTTIQVASILSQPGQPSRLRLLLDSSDLSLQGFYMELLEEQPGNNRFKSQSFGPTSTVFTPSTAVQTAFVSVQNNPPLDGGTFEPAWVVASGLATLQSGDQAMINGQAFDLTLAPSPAATSGPLSGVRARLPVVVVPDKGSSQAPNVLVGLQGQNPPVSRPYTFTFTSSGVSITRRSGSIVLSPAVVVRGSKVTLTTSYITAVGGEPEVTGMSVSGTGVTTTFVQRQEQQVSIDVIRVTTTFSMTVDRTATIGLRDLTFTLDNGQTKMFPKILKVSRGRMVIFAIDGFGYDFFNQVKENPAPPVSSKALGTALAVIFGENYRGTGLLEKKPLLTSFPPITFSRWSTMFSGSFPAVTGVPANEWLNRTTLPVPGGNLGGALSQALGDGDFFLAQWVNGSSDAYNRHFIGTRFVYDDLRDAQFRSIVLGQQAGLGMGNSGPHGDDVWEPFGATDFLRWANPLSPYGGATDLDEGSTSRAIGEIRKNGDSFDLMVVYLPGLDHYLHGCGVSPGNTDSGCPSTGSLTQVGYFFFSALHGRLNRITRALEQSFGQTTVYGVFGDHGLVDTTKSKFMYLGKQGSFLQNSRFKTWQRTLEVNGNTLVGDTLKTGVFQSNVIFDAQYGLAYIYVANNAPVAGNPLTFFPDFTRPPSLDVLEPFVDQIYQSYITFATSWSNRPISDILVRVPGTAGFSDSSYMVVPRDYKLSGTFACGASGTDECRLANQLQPPGYLVGKGYGDPPEARWQYALPTERLARLNSPNSGDIVVLANMSAGFHFDSNKGIPGNHGSLAFADAVVPVAFGYPGGDALPDVLKPIVTYLEGLSPIGYSTASGDGAVWDGVTEAEATAIRRFFLSP